MKVNEILLECGETGGIPDKSKPDIYKKNKKMKKQKKAAKKIKEKHKTVEDSPLITYDMKETEVFEQVLSLSGIFDFDEFALGLRPYLTTLYLTNFCKLFCIALIRFMQDTFNQVIRIRY